MTREQLIGRVAAGHIADVLGDEGGHARFCIVGMDGSLAQAIGDAVRADPRIGERIDVEIPSGESAAHKRNKPIGKSILFAVDSDELHRIGKTLETLPRLETDRLRERHDLWISESGMELGDEQEEAMAAALEAVALVGLAPTIEMHADYVLGVAEAVADGRRVGNALGEALPALHLPRGAGDLDQMPKRKLGDADSWARKFAALDRKVRPFLFMENQRGDRIDEQVRKNLEDMRRGEGVDPPTEEESRVIDAFLSATLTRTGWSGEQDDLARLEWSRIHFLFDGVEREAVTLVEQTAGFFGENFPDSLDEEDREFLGRYDARKSAASAPREAFDFFDRHKEIIATHDSRLYAKWERHLFKQQRVHDDFLEGIVGALERLQARLPDGPGDARSTLRVSVQRSGKKLFWDGKNKGLMGYFAQRYHGVEKLFGKRVEFDLGDISTYHLRQDNPPGGASSARAARQLKFEVEMRIGEEREQAIFFWDMPAAAVPAGLPGDLETVCNFGGERALLSTGRVDAQTVSAKGDMQHVDLEDRNTLLDTAHGSDGALAGEDSDIYPVFMAALEDLRNRGIVADDAAAEVRGKMERFAASYTEAVRAWREPLGEGLASPHMFGQAEAYRDLLETLAARASNDLSRKRLVEPLLRIGVVNVDGGPAAAIIAPWQPLRMAELASKAARFKEIVEDILGGPFVGHQYFDWRQKEMTAAYYPEVCIGLDPSGEPGLLSVERELGGYSLAESPLRAPEGRDDSLSNADSKVAAGCFGEVSENYLSLLPHEKSNFSAVLYNSQAKDLPRAIAERLAGQIEEEDDLQCDLLLVHTAQGTMRKVYEQQNAAHLDGAGQVISSEAALNFLARLRVGFVDTGTMAENPADLVFLQDVVARNARVKWKPATRVGGGGLRGHIPLHRLRRRPLGGADTATSVYLASPAQPAEGQAYVNALHQVLDRDYDGAQDMLPAREIDFGDSRIAEQFAQVHRLGHWVVSYDELVDRRLLERQGIQIVRHIRKRDTNRNVIVSTTREPVVLRSLLDQRLRDLDGGLSAEDRERIVGLLIARATTLSGQVVMRAARHSRYAHELIGMVLGMGRVERALGSPHIGWYFLDDCAAWFGQAEEHIADILALSPMVEDGAPVLKAALAETKYVGSRSHVDQKRKSARQLEETALRLARALRPGGNRLNRQDWLHLVANLMLENMEPFGNERVNGWDLREWSEKVRADEVPIRLAGFSHVFVHDEEVRVASPGEAFPLKTAGCHQVVLDSALVRKAVRALGGMEEEEGPPVEAAAGWENAMSTGRDAAPSPAPVPTPAHEPEPDAPRPPGSPAESAGPAEPAAASDAGVPGWLTPDFAGWIGERSEEKGDEEGKEKWLGDAQRKLKVALHGYDLEPETLAAELTPSAARIRFRGSNHMTVRKVEGLRQELLTSHAIEVTDVRAAPGEVVVMVRRPDREILHLRDLWKERALPGGAGRANASPLIGTREDNGEPLYLNVDDAFGGLNPHGPHTLIAGETGSGKGVLVRTLLLDICATNSPEAAKVWMIDPKGGVDFPWIRGLPHLEGGLITGQGEAAAALDGLVDEMERRSRLFAESGTAKLSDHNRKAGPGGRLPRIWVFHEEFADWMLQDDYRKSVETDLARLGVKARAAGIHLVMITQRPDSRVFPMQLRANLSNRLCLKVADRRNSRLILDEDGAERLLGRGHLAARLSGEGEIMRAQVPYTSDKEGEMLGGLIAKMWAGRG